MKFTCRSIDSIKGIYSECDMQVIIDVDLSKEQCERLFCLLWEYLGDDILTQEGYVKVVKP